ncbi:maleate cis-trans isomerase family protein [Acidocella facilis]|uniref:maleate cis-trans isomerase family protein n=1 Tax=Acidocella facilis TaxID=525 RepID=UPI001F1831FB|nr:aspartate/glutamate racemase family protein [Acidocella facilis]
MIINYGTRARIGLLMPSGNSAAEPQFQAMLPAGVSLHTTRLKLNGSSEQQLLSMVGRVEEGAALLADAGVDLITFNCTAVSTWDETMEAGILRRIHASAHLPATSTAEALVAALTVLSARSIVLITPYIEPVNRREIAFFERHNFSVLSCSGLNLETPAQMVDIEPEAWYEIVRERRHEEADAYLISCTAIRSAEIIEPLEQLLGRPVLTSNQATAWWSLRRLGLADDAPKFGRLFKKAGWNQK